MLLCRWKVQDQVAAQHLDQIMSIRHRGASVFAAGTLLDGNAENGD
jgi:hypothetical protein